MRIAACVEATSRCHRLGPMSVTRPTITSPTCTQMIACHAGGYCVRSRANKDRMSRPPPALVLEEGSHVQSISPLIRGSTLESKCACIDLSAGIAPLPTPSPTLYVVHARTCPPNRFLRGVTEMSLLTRCTTPATDAMRTPLRTYVPCPLRKPASALIVCPGVTSSIVCTAAERANAVCCLPASPAPVLGSPLV